MIQLTVIQLSGGHCIMNIDEWKQVNTEAVLGLLTLIQNMNMLLVAVPY
jgi:hypothetical protein